jgi:hypothetical protein
MLSRYIRNIDRLERNVIVHNYTNRAFHRLREVIVYHTNTAVVQRVRSSMAKVGDCSSSSSRSSRMQFRHPLTMTYPSFSTRSLGYYNNPTPTTTTTHSTLWIHSEYVQDTNVSQMRYYHSTTGTNEMTTKETNKKSILDEEDQILDKMEEIIDVPASAISEVIDRSKYTVEIPVKMPDLGTSHDNKPDRYSLVKEWFFQAGDIIQREDVLCDIQTPDFTFGMESDDEGVSIMGSVLVDAGKPVPDGTVICVLLHESKNSPELANETPLVPIAQGNDEEEDDEEGDGKNSKPNVSKT